MNKYIDNHYGKGTRVQASRDRKGSQKLVRETSSAPPAPRDNQSAMDYLLGPAIRAPRAPSKLDSLRHHLPQAYEAAKAAAQAENPSNNAPHVSKVNQHLRKQFEQLSENDKQSLDTFHEAQLEEHRMKTEAESGSAIAM